VFHSLDFSTISLKMKTRLEHDLPGQNPCCSSLRFKSRAVLGRCSLIVANILLGTYVILIPLQLPHIRASPFLKSLTRIPLVQSTGIFSLFQILTRRAVHIVIQAQRDTFSISAVIPSTLSCFLINAF
jgi:hypothetical protein